MTRIRNITPRCMQDVEEALLKKPRGEDLPYRGGGKHEGHRKINPAQSSSIRANDQAAKGITKNDSNMAGFNDK
jgi:hypothetical protein